MIHAEVQFSPYGELFTFLVPDDTEHGDEVVAFDPVAQAARKATVIAIGSPWHEAVPVIAVIREGGREEAVG